jgi:hypothetical protein
MVSRVIAIGCAGSRTVVAIAHVFARRRRRGRRFMLGSGVTAGNRPIYRWRFQCGRRG